MSAAKANTIANADAEIRTKIKNRGSTHYWEATVVDDYVQIGRELTFAEACARVNVGGDVFAFSSEDARKLASTCSNNLTPIHHDKHECKTGYYNHYHIRSKNGSHIFYF